jgi:hypothetical protein
MVATHRNVSNKGPHNNPEAGHEEVGSDYRPELNWKKKKEMVGKQKRYFIIWFRRVQYFFKKRVK